jgi:hypothetical protein
MQSVIMRIVSAALFLASFSTGFVNERRISLPLPVHPVHQFPAGTWIENLAVRSSGEILATVLGPPQIYQVDPFSTDKPASLIYTFPNATVALGIVETTKDIFYVLVGTYDTRNDIGILGSFGIWRLDLTNFHPAELSSVVARKVVDIPGSVLPNGLTAFSDEILLAADSKVGVVWRANICTGHVTIAVDDPLLKVVPSATIPAGVNGVHIRGKHLYFTNSAQGILGKVLLNSDGYAGGPAVVISSVNGPDDFVLDKDGNVLVALNPDGKLAFSSRHGHVTVLAQDLINPTAVQFGRLSQDSGSLYISTGGGSISRVDVRGVCDACCQG